MDKDIYNSVFSEGGHDGVYSIHYSHTCYYPLYRKVLNYIKDKGFNNILEVGCGNGNLANFNFDKYDFNYVGFDTSSVGVEKAIEKTKNKYNIFVGDATESDSYKLDKFDLDCIVCTEVLEHIEDDLTVVNHWQKGISCIVSVPNFDSKYHVRYFNNEKDVTDRYGHLINIEKIIRIKKPYLADISTKNVLRQVRWHRYKFGELIKILNFASFEKLGGWFVVFGTKK